MSKFIELFEEWKEVGEAREPLDVYNDSTSVRIEADVYQVALIAEGLRKAIPLFIEEGEHEIVAELRAMLVEIER